MAGRCDSNSSNQCSCLINGITTQSTRPVEKSSVCQLRAIRSGSHQDVRSVRQLDASNGNQFMSETKKLLMCLILFGVTTSAAAQEVCSGVFRTPDERFENLQDYPFEPHYVEVDSKLGKLRMHYVDVGPKDGDPILLMHGEPSWSYLYRKMIPPLVAAGHRVIAPDLIGFGRSDKPANRTDHSYQDHVDWMTQFVTELDLKNVTLFCQDWGSLIGLRVVTGAPDRFACIVAGNAALPAGRVREGRSP